MNVTRVTRTALMVFPVAFFGTTFTLLRKYHNWGISVPGPTGQLHTEPYILRDATVLIPQNVVYSISKSFVVIPLV